MRIAGVSRVSLVSALKAKPSTAMRLPVTVPNSRCTSRALMRCCCQALRLTTDSQ